MEELHTNFKFKFVIKMQDETFCCIWRAIDNSDKKVLVFEELNLKPYTLNVFLFKSQSSVKGYRG